MERGPSVRSSFPEPLPPPLESEKPPGGVNQRAFVGIPTYYILWSHHRVGGRCGTVLAGMVFSWSFGLSLVALACSALALLAAGRRTPSAFAKTAQKTAEDVVAKWTTEAQLFEATRERWAAEFSGIAERCEETLDRAESKRRRVAATESRTNAAAGNGGDPYAGMTREQIIDSARRRSLGAGG